MLRPIDPSTHRPTRMGAHEAMESEMVSMSSMSCMNFFSGTPKGCVSTVYYKERAREGSCKPLHSQLHPLYNLALSQKLGLACVSVGRKQLRLCLRILQNVVRSFDRERLPPHACELSSHQRPGAYTRNASLDMAVCKLSVYRVSGKERAYGCMVGVDDPGSEGRGHKAEVAPVNPVERICEVCDDVENTHLHARARTHTQTHTYTHAE
eukprot:2074237-Rhodomonas_salina.1